MYSRFISSVFLVVVSFTFGYAQQIEPKGYFLKDSLKIGIKTPFVLTLTYPRSLDVVFPDSLYNFTPFELDEKLYFPTVSNDSMSYDSAVYYITSFEIDSTQYFKLPVYIINSNDSTEIFTSEDSILLQHMVSEMPDSVAVEALPLIENTTYKRVMSEFNYPYWVIALIALGVLLTLGFILFNKPIRRYLKIKALTKNHTKFVETFDKSRNSDNSIDSKAESILVVWKKYLEKLEKQPYTRLTTKEIMLLKKQEDLNKSLKSIDRIIYAGKDNGDSENAFGELMIFADKAYYTKLEEVKNG